MYEAASERVTRRGRGTPETPTGKGIRLNCIVVFTQERGLYLSSPRQITGAHPRHNTPERDTYTPLVPSP